MSRFLPLLLSGALCLTVLPLAQIHASSSNPSAINSTDQTPISPEESAGRLASRLLDKRAQDFYFIIDPSLKNEKIRKVGIRKAENGKIVISGDSAISLTSGLNLYLKRFANAHISWAHHQLNLPAVLPGPEKTAYFETAQKHATAFNYCTFNYTMAWWNAERWQKELDILALYGIDTPLAIVGTEEIWLNVLQQFGYTKEDALKFLVGPAYTAWWLMGNCQGIGGPVTEEYVRSKTLLQKKILARMRELGMNPILQGFVGLVPTDFAEKNKDARLIPQGSWCNVPRPAVLHPDDPLFEKVGQAWYKEQRKLYGNVKIFAGDLFHEGGNSRGIDLPAMGTKVQKIMTQANPEAIWSLQCWGGNPSPNLLKGLDPEHTEVVDLCNEAFTNWEKKKGFSGMPWYFSTIIQYGGNVSLHGRLPAIWKNYNKARNSIYTPAGMGLTWESTGINPVVADLVTDIHWNPGTSTLNEWVNQYADRRYGLKSDALREAWGNLLESAYGEYPNHRRPTESIFCARPGMNVQKTSPFEASVHAPYDARKLKQALVCLLKEKEKLRDTETYRHDLVDVTRQLLTILGLQTYRNMMKAEKEKNREVFQKESGLFLSLMDKQDKLLSSEKDFMLGPWLQDARAAAPTGQEDLFEQQARNLVTVWFPDRTPASLTDYGWREWSGLLSNYYKPRWQAFITHRLNLMDGKESKAPDFATMEKNWAKKTIKDDAYPVEPTGDSLAEVEAIATECFPLFEKSGYTPPILDKSGETESAEDAR